MSRVFLSFILCIFASNLWAMSCLPKNTYRSFGEAAAAGQTDFVAIGVLEYLGETPHVPGAITLLDRSNPPRFEAQAVFRGLSVTDTDVSSQVDIDLTVEVTCVANWCGAFPAEDTQILAFIDQRPEGRVLSFGPCMGPSIVAATQEDVKIAQSCLKGGTCK